VQPEGAEVNKKERGVRPSLYPAIYLDLWYRLERTEIGVLLEDLGDRGGELGTDEQTNYLPDYRNRFRNALHLIVSYP
jgi:hypothetical protein